MVTKPVQMPLPLTPAKTSRFRAGSLRTKETLHEALKRALFKLDRGEVAKELSRLVGENISVHTLNNYCAEGKTNRRFPLEWAKALVMITGDVRILSAALEPEFVALDEKGRVCLEYGRLVLEDKERSRRKRQLQERAREILQK